MDILIVLVIVWFNRNPMLIFSPGGRNTTAFWFHGGFSTIWLNHRLFSQHVWLHENRECPMQTALPALVILDYVIRLNVLCLILLILSWWTSYFHGFPKASCPDIAVQLSASSLFARSMIQTLKKITDFHRAGDQSISALRYDEEH